MTPDAVTPPVNEFPAPHLRESELAHAVFHDPSSMSARLALADFLLEQNRDRDASIVLRNALETFPNHCQMMLKLGEILHQYPAFQDEAIELLSRVISINASVFAAYRPLVWTLNYRRRHEEAVTTLRGWCAAAPTDPVAAHLLAAYTRESIPDRASDAFVKHTFDQAAETFDTYLRDTLQYRAPEALGTHLATLVPASAGASLDVLDMGCGTGLSAPVLRPWARHLSGVDLSTGMLEKAREANGYDILDAAELTVYLDQKSVSGPQFDLLFAADTLVYFGRLDEVLNKAFAALRAGGWIAFTVEHLSTRANDSESQFSLETTGRYKHSEEYVVATLSSAGFLKPHIILDRVRSELDAPQIALIVAAMKPL